MRNRLNHPKPLRRVIQLLAFAALTVGVLPAATAGAESRTVGQKRKQTAAHHSWHLIADRCRDRRREGSPLPALSVWQRNSRIREMLDRKVTVEFARTTAPT
jgi:hypothetical protein